MTRPFDTYAQGVRPQAYDIHNVFIFYNSFKLHNFQNT